uniref:Uncharacterized protein n=1 Tax=Arundo donax TaxID=35708 RepID=A0A0A9U362_ARUDO
MARGTGPDSPAPDRLSPTTRSPSASHATPGQEQNPAAPPTTPLLSLDQPASTPSGSSVNALFTSSSTSPSSATTAAAMQESRTSIITAGSNHAGTTNRRAITTLVARH